MRPGVRLPVGRGLLGERRDQRARGVAHQLRARRTGPSAACRSGRGRTRRTRRAARRPRRRGRRPRCPRRAAARGGTPARPRAPESSSVAAWVTRADSSWASSITTTSYSGIIGTPSMASIASSEWLVTISWDWAAFSLARSAKHSSENGQRWAPRHSRWLTETCRHTLSVCLGRRVTVAGALGLGLLLGPGPQREHLAAHRAGRHLDQRALVVGDALADAVQAGVVGAALEDGVRRLAVQHVVGGLEQGGDVALDELVLEREGRGRDDHAPVVEQRRDEVGQRLAGAGAGLDQQVLAGRHRPGDGLGHLDLTGPLLAAERLDGAGEDLADGRLGLGHRSTLPSRAPGRRRRSTGGADGSGVRAWRRTPPWPSADGACPPSRPWRRSDACRRRRGRCRGRP